MLSSKYPKRSNKLVAVMMVKNEAVRIIPTTLVSIKDYCSDVVIFDTGSTDGTQTVIKNYCNEHNLNFYIKEGTFVDFSISRNILLDFCDEIYKDKDMYLLLLDAHDELQNGETLVEFVNNHNGPQTGMYLTQRWLSGNNLDSYYNIRMVRTHKQWRYKCPVHEYMMTPILDEKKVPENEIIYKLENVYLYQDRTKDDDKSFKRFKRDKELLYEEYLKNPTEPRTLFYLAQTCSCLNMIEESYKYYLLRIKCLGFFEEIYHSYYRLGDLSRSLGHDWEESLNWYLKAYQHSLRAEPLCKIATYYIENNLSNENKPEWHTAYMYISMACQLTYPVNNILFISNKTYTYERWHLMGRIGYYVGRYKEGKDACIKAIECENKDLDKINLKFYLEKELEILMHPEKLTCLCFIAVSFGDLEIRTKQDFNNKHDKNIIYQEVVDTIIESRRRESRPLSKETIILLREGKTNTGINQTNNNNQLPDKPVNIKKDRRTKLREMVNNKKLGKT